MGNGRGWSGKSSRSRLRGLCINGAVFSLFLVGCILLETGSHPHSQKALARTPTSLFPTVSDKSLSPSKPDVSAILSHLPLIFEPNQGQADSKVKFLARGAGYSLYLDASG